jgi:hypothetical protein
MKNMPASLHSFHHHRARFRPLCARPALPVSARSHHIRFSAPLAIRHAAAILV